MYQGAELMGKFGINVPKGAAAGSIEEVKNVMKNMFSNEKEVMLKAPYLFKLNCFDILSHGDSSSHLFSKCHLREL